MIDLWKSITEDWCRTMTLLQANLVSGYVLSLGWLEQRHSSGSFFCDGLSQVYHHLVSGSGYVLSLGWLEQRHTSASFFCDGFYTSIIIWSLEWLRVVTRLAGAVPWFWIILLWWTFTSLSSAGLWSGYVLSLGWLEQCHSSASFFCDGLSHVYHHLVSGVATCCH